MPHDEATRAGRAILALLSILAFSPMVVSARRAVTMSRSEATEEPETIEGHVSVSHTAEWNGRLLISLDYKSTGTWQVEPLEPGALMLSNGGLYVYKGEGWDTAPETCERPALGFRHVNYVDSVTICNASVYLDLYTVREVQEGQEELPKQLLGEGALLQLQDLDLARYNHASLADVGYAYCFGLQGCSDKACSDGLRSVKVCSPDHATLQQVQVDIDKAMVERTQLKKLFPSEVAHAVNHGMLKVLDRRHRLPSGNGFFSFSPYNVPGNEVRAQEMLAKLRDSFSKGVIAHEPGKNSRSGAIFFFSKDKKYMAKRIRRPEMLALWKLARDRSMFEREEAGSILSPIYLAFSSDRTAGSAQEVLAEEHLELDNWIIMRTESLGPEIDALLDNFGRVKEFFYDVKPEPMESDRLKALREFSVEHLRDGFRGSDLPGWKNIVRTVANDVGYLDSQTIVDYSAFMYGAHFDVYNSTTDYAEKIKRIHALMSSRTGCTAGCRDSTEVLHFPLSEPERWLPTSPRADRELIDVTSKHNSMDPGTFSVTTDGQTETYNCCCFRIHPGQSHSVYSPCVLVNTKTPRQNPLWWNDCGNKLGRRWQDYTKTEAKYFPLTKGRCIVDYEGLPYPKDPPQRFRELGEQNLILKPGRAFNLQAPAPLVAKCTVMCMSLADYLLEFDLFKQIENLVLALWYKDLKWTDYNNKFKALVDCFSAPGMSHCDTFTLEEDKHEIDTEVVDRLVDLVL